MRFAENVASAVVLKPHEEGHGTTARPTGIPRPSTVVAGESPRGDAALQRSQLVHLSFVIPRDGWDCRAKILSFQPQSAVALMREVQSGSKGTRPYEQMVIEILATRLFV
jgi:hypothetical protein